MSGKKRRPSYRISALINQLKERVVNRVGLAPFLIWAFTFAPLFDGVYFSAAATGQLTLTTSEGFWSSIAFGVACFSGGGAVAAALALTGSRRQRVFSVVGVYLTIALGIVLELGLLAWTSWEVPAEATIVGAGVLLALAALMLGIKIQFSPMPAIVILTLCLFFENRTEDDGPATRGVRFELAEVAAASAVALSVGLLLTLMAAVISSKSPSWLDPAWITRAGAGAIALIAAGELGLPIPAASTMLVLPAGILTPLLLKTRAVRRARCWLRARRIVRCRNAVRIDQMEATS